MGGLTVLTLGDIENIYNEFIKFYGHEPTTIRMGRREWAQFAEDHLITVPPDGMVAVTIEGMNLVVEDRVGVTVESEASAKTKSWQYRWHGDD